MASNWISKKLIVVGNPSVGKTSLISRFIYRKFPEDYISTLGVTISKKTVDIGDTSLNMIIWEIAGEEEVSEIPSGYLKGTSGVIIVFDLTRQETYHELKEWVSWFDDMLHDAKVVIVGNKSDLLSQEEIDEIVGTLSIKPDIVSSAKTGDNVDTLFSRMAEMLLEA